VGQATVVRCGYGGEGDLVAAEVFELADEVALAARLVESRRVEVGTEVVEAGVGA
jgi:hypothetical protein